MRRDLLWKETKMINKWKLFWWLDSFMQAIREMLIIYCLCEAAYLMNMWIKLIWINA
jgi:hypothetical protein